MEKTLVEPAPVSSLGGKYLTFRLGEESYGLAVLRIREIIRLTPITAVPQMPPFVKGVINLRGKIIPVVDLRLKFGLGAGQTTERTCIVVVQTARAGDAHALMGLVVDAVEEVVQIAVSDIEDTPDFGASLNTEYILGMAKLKSTVCALLDIDKAVGNDLADLAPH